MIRMLLLQCLALVIIIVNSSSASLSVTDTLSESSIMDDLGSGSTPVLDPLPSTSLYSSSFTLSLQPLLSTDAVTAMSAVVSSSVITSTSADSETSSLTQLVSTSDVVSTILSSSSLETSSPLSQNTASETETSIPTMSVTTAAISTTPATTIIMTTTPIMMTSLITTIPTPILSEVPTTIISTSVLTIVTNTPSVTPVCDIWCTIAATFTGSPQLLIAAAVGGFFILVLLLVILVLCIFCCCKSYRKRQRRYWLEDRMQSNINGEVRHFRPSISLPIRQAGSSWQEQNKIAETVLGGHELSVDNGYHPSQSQAGYSQSIDGLGNAPIPMLTPMNPSQIIRQAQISVDDDLPEHDPHGRVSLSVDDSPFMPLSNNLSGSTSSRFKLNSRSVDSPPQLDSAPNRSQNGEFQDASQYSYLGLGVHHGSDLIITNTASLLENELGGIGLIGIERTSQTSTGRQRVSHQIDVDEQLDETPVLITKEESAESKKSSRKHSYSIEDTPVRDNGPFRLPAEPEERSNTVSAATPARQEGRPRADTEGAKKSGRKTSLSALTSLSTKPNRFNSREQLVSSELDDLQEKPERQRLDTAPAAASNSNFKRGAGGKSTSKLGKLTSLEYIRNSLRKMRRKTSNGREVNGHEKRKKHLKPALKQSSSTSSTPDHGPPTVYHNQYTSGAGPYGGYRDRASTAPSYAHPAYTTSPSNQFIPAGPTSGYTPDGYHYPPTDYMDGNSRYPVDLSQGGYAELSPILSVPYDYHEVPPDMIGLAPPYVLSDTGYLDSYPPHPHPPYNDLSPDNYADSYRQVDMGPSQRSVRWNLELEEIPRSPVDADELTPTDLT